MKHPSLRSKSFLFLCLVTVLLGGCVQAPAQRETLYQVSSISSLLAGNYDGLQTIEAVKKRGDIGIGTFDTLDGEMVFIDGKVYQVKDSGKVQTPPDSMKLPFAAVTFFDADVTQDLGPVANYEALKAALDQAIVRKDAFYAIRLDGLFTVKVRSVPSQKKPYPILSEITKNQPVYDYPEVKGSLVGFWCPDTVGGINVAGYHLHFISDDRALGGHLLEVSFKQATARLDLTRQFEMELAEDGALVGQGLNLSEEIQKVESKGTSK